jgi:diguanylate cyclase (GGDEF)-like protein
MQWQLGAWWSCDEGSEVLRCRSVWRCEPSVAEEFETFSLALELAPGLGLPGRVWASGEPEWAGDVAADASFPRAEVAARAGLHASVCVPVIAGREVRCAIEFFSTEVGEPDHAAQEMLGMIAAQIGGFVSLLDQRSKLVEKLQQLALTDELTGLPNRRAWQAHLERELARARRHREPLCVAILDLDRFKRFNDTHGHQAGDGLLRELAQAWRTQLRASDVLARYGGEEFSLLLPATPIEAAGTVLARMRSATPRDQTCSAGVATFDGSESEEDFVGRADAALYEAKGLGRNRTVIAELEGRHHGAT